MPGASPVGPFPPGQHVKKRRDFDAARDGGRRATLPHFVLLFFARGESGSPRLGIVASRKVGPAVTRNRAKRLVRETFRATRDLWMPGMDLVVIVRRSLDGMKLEHVTAEWQAAAGLIQKRTAEARADCGRRAESAVPTDLRAS